MSTSTDRNPGDRADRPGPTRRQLDRQRRLPGQVRAGAEHPTVGTGQLGEPVPLAGPELGWWTVAHGQQRHRVVIRRTQARNSGSSRPTVTTIAEVL
jgi:hypothetical protein